MAQPHTALPETVTEDITALVHELVTEDDTSVDNLFSEKQQRLLTEPLYSSWVGLPTSPDRPGERRTFLVAANVGLFPSLYLPPLVPDVFLSLDVEVADDWYDKRHRSYFFWEFGKAPEVVIEIVSNRKGNEMGSKLHDYARSGVTYYVVYDPLQQLSAQVLQVYEKRGMRYQPLASSQLPGIGLGVVLWEEVYEGKFATWLRWCDEQGQVIPTGAERAAREAEARQHAEAELVRLRAELERLQQHLSSQTQPE